MCARQSCLINSPRRRRGEKCCVIYELLNGAPESQGKVEKIRALSFWSMDPLFINPRPAAVRLISFPSWDGWLGGVIWHNLFRSEAGREWIRERQANDSLRGCRLISFPLGPPFVMENNQLDWKSATPQSLESPPIFARPYFMSICLGC